MEIEKKISKLVELQEETEKILEPMEKFIDAYNANRARMRVGKGEAPTVLERAVYEMCCVRINKVRQSYLYHVEQLMDKQDDLEQLLYLMNA